MLENPHIGEVAVGEELLLPDLGEAIDAVRMGADGGHQGLGDSIVHLVHIDPELVGRRLLVMLHRLHELVDDEGVIVDHHDIRADHLEVIVDLVEAEALLLRVLVGGRIVLIHTGRRLAMPGCVRVALEAVVKQLDPRRQGRGLLEKVMGDLGVARGLINMSADENDTH